MQLNEKLPVRLPSSGFKPVRVVVMFFLLLCAVSAHSQDTSTNYVSEYRYLDDWFIDEDSTRTAVSVRYFDGLGRAVGTADSGISGDGGYVHTLRQYDGLGRVAFEMRPVPSSDAGYIPSAAFSVLSSSYYGDSHAVERYVYDALGRKASCNIGGSSWVDNHRCDSVEYLTNQTGEVIRYRCTSQGVREDGSWASGTLRREHSIDADGHELSVYSDITGAKVLEDAGGSLTYYVYDDYRRLRYVLTPRYQRTHDLSADAHEYRYDGYGRVVYSRIPGCGETLTGYDRHGRRMTEQTPLLRERGLVRFFYYDFQGRLCLQGLCSSYSNSDSLALATMDGSGSSDWGYTFTPGYSEDDVRLKFERVNYYDSYSHLSVLAEAHESALSFSSTLSQEEMLYARGHLTASIESCSDGSQVYTSYRYDSTGRVVSEHHTGYGGKSYDIHTSYTFTDKPRRITEVYPLSDRLNDNLRIVSDYTYNAHNDNLESVSVRVNDGAMSKQVSYLEYDGLGRLSSSSRPSVGLRTDYSYDVHGWLKSQSCPSYFSEWLNYESGPGTDCYNGNLSSVLWEGSDAVLRGYRHQYDGRGLLTRSYYGEGSNLAANMNRYSEFVGGHDENGSMTGLLRRGKGSTGRYVTVDDLSFEYSGDRVVGVTDGVGTVLSYEDAFEYVDRHVHSVSDPDISYDSGGCLVSDKDRGISSVTYDDTGLVEEITFVNGTKSRYVHSVSGDCLCHEVTVSSAVASSAGVSSQDVSSSQSFSPGDMIVDREVSYGPRFVSGYGSSESRYLFDDGYISFPVAGGIVTPRYHYYIRDHQGSVRSVLLDDGGQAVEVQRTCYYPSGGIITPLSFGRGEQGLFYTGKKLDGTSSLYWYDYGMRMYDSALGMFTSPDPLSDKFPGFTPYSYCLGDPVNWVDERGLFPHYWGALVACTLNSFINPWGTSSVQDNGETANEKLRYTYNTVGVDADGLWITLHWRMDKSEVQTMQDVGDAMALAGYAATLSVVGAEVGVPLATYGNYLSGLGSFLELGIDWINGDITIASLFGPIDIIITKGLKYHWYNSFINDLDYYSKEIVKQSTDFKKYLFQKCLDKSAENKKE